MDYPTIDNFNPGDDDIEMQGNARPAYGDTYKLDDNSPVRDRAYDPRVDGERDDGLIG